MPRGTVRVPPARLGIVLVRLKLRHQHGRRRREVVRVDDLEQRLGEARELGVDLQLHPRRHEAGAFEQPLHVRVGHLEAAHAEPGGDLRELLGELAAHLAKMLKLEVVVVEETGIHYATRVGARSATSTCPVSRSISVRTSRSMGIGCAQSCPEISTPITL